VRACRALAAEREPERCVRGSARSRPIGRLRRRGLDLSARYARASRGRAALTASSGGRAPQQNAALVSAFAAPRLGEREGSTRWTTP
jgi:hypothetical protein